MPRRNQHRGRSPIPTTDGGVELGERAATPEVPDWGVSHAHIPNAGYSAWCQAFNCWRNAQPEVRVGNPLMPTAGTHEGGPRNRPAPKRGIPARSVLRWAAAIAAAIVAAGLAGGAYDTDNKRMAYGALAPSLLTAAGSLIALSRRFPAPGVERWLAGGTAAVGLAGTGISLAEIFRARDTAPAVGPLPPAPSVSPTATPPLPSASSSANPNPVITYTATTTATRSPDGTVTSTTTYTPTQTATSTASGSVTPSSLSVSQTQTMTATATTTKTTFATQTPTGTATITYTSSSSRSASASASASASVSATRTTTVTASFTPTGSRSASWTATQTATSSLSSSATPTWTTAPSSSASPVPFKVTEGTVTCPLLENDCHLLQNLKIQGGQPTETYTFTVGGINIENIVESSIVAPGGSVSVNGNSAEVVYSGTASEIEANLAQLTGTPTLKSGIFTMTGKMTDSSGSIVWSGNVETVTVGQGQEKSWLQRLLEAIAPADNERSVLRHAGAFAAEHLNPTARTKPSSALGAKP